MINGYFKLSLRLIHWCINLAFYGWMLCHVMFFIFFLFSIFFIEIVVSYFLIVYDLRPENTHLGTAGT